MSKSAKKKYVEKNVYEKGLERVERAYDLFDEVSVSFSGGKDSTVCLNLAIEVARKRGKLPVRVIFFDEEAIPYETEDYVRRVANLPEVNLEWYCLPVKHRNAASKKQPYWHPWNPAEKEKWVRPLPPEAITHVDGFNMELSVPNAIGLFFDPNKHGNCGCVMGIRAQESIIRYRNVATVARGKDNFIIRYSDTMQKSELLKIYGATSDIYKVFGNNNLHKVLPIYDWETDDVWKAPRMFGWDYNRAYDIMEMVGISHFKQRCAPPFGEEPLGGLWMFRECFPELWDKMYNRVEGADCAMRYAKSELYAFNEMPVLPEGMTWEQLIRFHIENFDEETSKGVAQRIQGEIALHYRKTSEPILDYAKHYDSGVSMSWLCMLAVRGDLKGRRVAKVPHKGSPEYEQLKNNYMKEYEIWKKENKDVKH